MRRGMLVVCGVLAGLPELSAGTLQGKVTLVEKNGETGSPAGAVVYVDGVKVKPTPARVAIAMKDKTFVPHQVVVPVGSVVEFPNEDGVFHNVFSVSSPNRFDLDLYKRPKKGASTFQQPGVVRVYCNIHPQMSAVVLVRDSSFYATVRRDGSYTIEGIPAGKYRVAAWHERAGERSAQVTIPETGTIKSDFSLDASAFKRVQHKNKYGKDYPAAEKY